MLDTLTQKLTARQDLAQDEAAAAALALASPEGASEAGKIDFLAALAAKGESAAEIAAFAGAYRGLARNPGLEQWASRAIDVVGTGGDHAGGFNISSLVTLTLASAGVPVIKHGNRGITSKCGSADLLAGFGYDLEAPPEKLRRAMDELGYCFLFAPAYHPAFKNIAPVRKALAARGQRTIFNLLGPLINPARPVHALVGVFAPSLLPKLAGALTTLGCTAGLVAHGEIADGRGIDEMTTATQNQVQGIGRMRGSLQRWSATDFGLPPARFDDLVGGDLTANLGIAEAVLAGRGPAGLVDTIVLNAAAAMWITGRVDSIRVGLEPARELLLGGAVARKIIATREFFRTG
jgi:anthranilate phosphoribosyltransferase